MKKFVAITLLVGFPLLSSGAINLTQAYELARDRDPSISAANFSRLANQKLRPAAIGTLLPQVSGSISESRARDESSTVTADVIRSHSMSLSLSQSLINFGLWFNLRKAGDLVDQAEATYVAAEQALMVRVTTAYFNILKAKDFLEFTQAKKKAVAQQLEETSQKYKVGLVAVTDLREAKARHDSATADVIAADNNLEDARETLQEITGEYSKSLMPLRNKMKLLPPDPVDVKTWIDTAQEHNPTLLASKANAAAAKENRNYQYAQHLPTVSLTGSRGRGRFGTFNNPTGNYEGNWAAGVELSMNIFSGGTIQANASKAAYDYQAALEELERVRRQTVKSTSSAYRGIQSAISRVHSLQQAVLSSRTALKASQDAYEVGERTSVDVLNSISDLFDNEQKLTEARHAYILNQMYLKQATGTLSESDISAINGMLKKSKA